MQSLSERIYQDRLLNMKYQDIARKYHITVEEVYKKYHNHSKKVATAARRLLKSTGKHTHFCTNCHCTWVCEQKLKLEEVETCRIGKRSICNPCLKKLADAPVDPIPEGRSYNTEPLIYGRWK